ncbi:acyl carrier protein [Paenibacillus hexagrammi]|uniref:Acyl carrier protein n=1 Tax=Paenibacillus hexagrammi TaxID=2908839 RepID=A0ABY3SBJ2_9BACL|nr:acyl carrier protein [Paenibacillus sp. YPD9-1]UJF31357.1 acyl carrier protein [Paenibacillus sp. YPD9-1]
MSTNLNLNLDDQIVGAIQEIAVGVEAAAITDDRLLTELGIDSLKYVELLVRIEELCEITFNESDLGVESLRSVGDLKSLTARTAGTPDGLL